MKMVNKTSQQAWKMKSYGGPSSENKTSKVKATSIPFETNADSFFYDFHKLLKAGDIKKYLYRLSSLYFTNCVGLSRYNNNYLLKI